MQVVINFLLSILKKLFFYGLVFLVLIWGWNKFKDQREARTFLISFDNVEGLAKGSPIYSSGIKIGKVIKIFPLGNTNEVAVKGLLTDKEFPSPRAGVSARIVTNYGAGGGKALEIINLGAFSEDEIEVREHEYLGSKVKGSNSLPLIQVQRIFRDFFQMSKDFGRDAIKAINSDHNIEYREELGNRIQSTITSFEYDTMQSDMKNSIDNINENIRNFEAKENKQATVERNIRNKVEAIKNTLDSYGSLSKVYKEE